MLLNLSEDERQLSSSVSAFVEKTLRPSIGKFALDHEFPTDLVRAFCRLGFMGTAYDPAHRGGGFGTRGAALVCELLAHCEPSFAAIFLCNSAPMSVIARYGSHEVKKRFLAPLCAGEFIASFGVTEPHGGSDVAQIKTRAVADGEHFVINGSKVFSTNAGTPLHGLSTVIAMTDPDKGPKGLSTFVIPVGTPGFTIGKAGHKIGWRLADSVELFFSDCRVPATCMIGNRGDGLKQILSTLSIGRILVAAAALGLTRRAVDLSKSYGQTRHLFGRSILENQGLAFPLADILTKIHASELMVRNAAWRVDNDLPFRAETSMVKLFASEMAMEAANLAIQVHGGYGVFHEYEVAGLLGEAKVLSLVEGTSEIQRMVIARELTH